MIFFSVYTKYCVAHICTKKLLIIWNPIQNGHLFVPPKCDNPLLEEKRNYTQLLVVSISIYPTYGLRSFYAPTDVSLWESTEGWAPKNQRGNGP